MSDCKPNIVNPAEDSSPTSSLDDGGEVARRGESPALDFLKKQLAHYPINEYGIWWRDKPTDWPQFLASPFEIVLGDPRDIWSIVIRARAGFKQIAYVVLQFYSLTKYSLFDVLQTAGIAVSRSADKLRLLARYILFSKALQMITLGYPANVG
ncbi:MAG TPA: hypothetical protein VMF62_12290 [Acetobacteraceae bacterium]|nr:hypothetical protein [Acetobacteraceae bacterium]